MSFDHQNRQERDHGIAIVQGAPEWGAVKHTALVMITSFLTDLLSA